MTPSLGLSGWMDGELFPRMRQTRETDQVFITGDAKVRTLQPHTSRSLDPDLARNSGWLLCSSRARILLENH